MTFQHQHKAEFAAQEAGPTITESLSAAEFAERVEVHYEECVRLRSYLDRLVAEIQKQSPAIASAIMKGVCCVITF